MFNSYSIRFGEKELSLFGSKLAKIRGACLILTRIFLVFLSHFMEA